MEVFLTIVGVIVILKVVNSLFYKKRLENEVAFLKCQLDTANYIINHNNKVIEKMMRNAGLKQIVEDFKERK